jgi:hypothetical protein
VETHGNITHGLYNPATVLAFTCNCWPRILQQYCMILWLITNMTAEKNGEIIGNRRQYMAFFMPPFIMT